MRFSTQIQPVESLQTRAEELLDQVLATREPIVIVKNNKPKAVLLDICSYEQAQDSLALMQILAIGDREIEEGKSFPIEQIVEELRIDIGKRKPPSRRSRR